MLYPFTKCAPSYNEKAKTARKPSSLFAYSFFKNGDRPIVGMHHGASAIRLHAANSLIIGCPGVLPYMRVPVHPFFHPQPPSSDPVGVALL